MAKNDYRRVKWGLIGAGEFGLLYAHILKQLPNVDLVSVYSHNMENAKKAAEAYDIPNWYDDYNKQLASDDLEAVAIVTAEPFHHDPMVAAAKAKKHVIIEKPIAPKLDEAEKMIKVAKEEGILFAVAHILPFHTHYAMAKAEIDKGSVGDIVSIYARRNAASFWGARLQDHSSAIYDEMIHDMECILWYTGWKVKRVYAQTKNVRGMKKPDVCWAMFTFENGEIAVLEANWFLPANTPMLIDSQMEIHGTDGMVYIDLADQGFRVNDKSGWRTPDTNWWPTKLGRVEGALGDELRYFADGIMLGELPGGVGDPERAKYALEIVLAAEKSAETGEIVEL
ncbi:Gfo/Idh/MocA family protein [Actinomycetota bacterium]